MKDKYELPTLWPPGSPTPPGMACPNLLDNLRVKPKPSLSLLSAEGAKPSRLDIAVTA